MGRPMVALLTDFGTRDGYAGIMQAVLLRRNPRLLVIDLSHEIEPHCLLSGAYVLYSAWEQLPRGTVFCAVVDPGVGGPRIPLLAAAAGRLLVAPDNGLVSLLARMYPGTQAFRLPEPPGSVPAASHTFHGRDLFAPAAAQGPRWLLRHRGHPLQPRLLPEAWIRRSAPAALAGCVLHVDRFGNAITCIRGEDLEALRARGQPQMRAGSLKVSGLCHTYEEVPKGAPLALVGSCGFVELAVREGSAAARYGLRVGQEVRVRGVQIKQRA